MTRILNPRDQAIIDWVKENHPELVGTLEQVIDSKGAFLTIFGPFRTLYVMLEIGFSAGRKFQRDNQDAPDEYDEGSTCA